MTVVEWRHLPGRHSQKLHAGARTIGSSAEAKAFMDDHYGGWRKGLTSAEYGALSFYQSPGFALMNGQLRGLKKGQIKADVSFNDADLKRARKASADLKKAIAKAPPLKENLVLHRGFSADQFGTLKPGMRIQDKGFVSTSLTSDVASVGRATSPAVAVIKVPAGTRAGAGSARELILSPDSEFTVTGTTQKAGTTFVELELVG